jgi:hypothetical protein
MIVIGKLVRFWKKTVANGSNYCLTVSQGESGGEL